MSDEIAIIKGTGGMSVMVDANQISNEAHDLYVERLVRELRVQLGWEIKSDGPVYAHVREFSKLYSEINRDVEEVAAIYRLAFQPGQP